MDLTFGPTCLGCQTKNRMIADLQEQLTRINHAMNHLRSCFSEEELWGLSDKKMNALELLQSHINGDL
jgi:hypothetical protein